MVGGKRRANKYGAASPRALPVASLVFDLWGKGGGEQRRRYWRAFEWLVVQRPEVMPFIHTYYHSNPNSNPNPHPVTQIYYTQ